jgi:hypothetical protein
MAEQGSHYHRGEMDVHEQVATFHLFGALTKWGSLHLATLLVFLVLWFCTGAGFLGALVAAVVVAVLGALLLRGGGGH